MGPLLALAVSPIVKTIATAVAVAVAVRAAETVVDHMTEKAMRAFGDEEEN